MDFISVASILCLLIGLFVGGTIVAFSGFTAGKKSNKILDDAKKEAEKTKRNSLMELKEETFKLNKILLNIASSTITCITGGMFKQNI